jgi:hypothetical protein
MHSGLALYVGLILVKVRIIVSILVGLLRLGAVSRLVLPADNTTQTNKPRVGLEPTIPEIKHFKTVHDLTRGRL